MNCRRAMELAVKWMYAVDKQLVMPYKKDLSVLLSTVEFVDLVDDKNLLRRLDFLRRLGNTAAHSTKKISRDQARLALENLFYFLDFIACCYDPDYQPQDFDPALLASPFGGGVAAAGGDGEDPLSRLRRQLSQRESQGAPPHGRSFWRKTRSCGNSLPSGGRSRSPPTSPSPWTSPSTRRGSSTSTPCSRTRAGRRASTG